MAYALLYSRGRMSRATLRGAAIAALAAFAALFPCVARGNQESAVTLTAGLTTPEAKEIQTTLENYVKAIETKDIALFKRVKPNITPDEERRLKTAFESVKSHAITLAIQSIELQGGSAIVRVARRDTLNATIVNSFSQVFQMAKDAKAWNIQEMRR
jgi:hypothetical protein